MQDVAHDAALAQELGVGDDAEVGAGGGVLADQGGDQLGRAERHRALVDDDDPPAGHEVGADRGGGGAHLAQIRLAVGERRGAGAEEDELGRGHGGGVVGGEAEVAGGDGARPADRPGPARGPGSRPG